MATIAVSNARLARANSGQRSDGARLDALGHHLDHGTGVNAQPTAPTDADRTGAAPEPS
jgi:hypothetical protein